MNSELIESDLLMNDTLDIAAAKKRKFDQVTPDSSSNTHVLLDQLSLALNEQTMWTTKARVIFKSLLNMTSNNKSAVLNLRIADQNGNIVRVVCFNDAAHHYFRTVELDHVYVISKSLVKQNTNVHSSAVASQPGLNTSFDLEFDLQATKLVPSLVANNDALFVVRAPPIAVADITSVQSLRSQPVARLTGTVNMIGVVVGIGSLQTVSTGKQKYDLILVDHSTAGSPTAIGGGNSALLGAYAVTMWSRFEVIHGLCVGRPLLLRQVRVGQYNGKMQLSLSYESTVEELSALVRHSTANGTLDSFDNSPTTQIYKLLLDSCLTRPLPTVAELFKAFASSKVSRRSTFQEMINDVESSATLPVSTSIADIYKEVTTCDVTTALPKQYKIRGRVRSINMQRALYYLACPQCRKKMIEPVAGQYQCQNTAKCIEQPPETRPDVTYSLAVNVGAVDPASDGALLDNCVAFAKIGVQLLGIPAQTIMDNKQNLDLAEFTSWWTDSIVAPIINNIYEFDLTVSADDSKRVQYRINSISKC